MEKNMNIMVETLIRGRDSAKKLHNLLCQKGNNDGSVSVNDLVMEISKSFGEGISMLNSCGFGEICGPHVGLTCSSDQQSEVITGNNEKNILTPLAKESRGRYKKSKNVDSSVKVSDTSEDVYVWRKYGQKEIINSKYPRCYFRCTYKDDQGCMALKQVQQLEGESNKFRIKYFGRHTCTTTSEHIDLHPPPAGPGVLLDFEGFKNNGPLAGKPSTTKHTHINHSKKQKVQSNKVKSLNDAPSDQIFLPGNISIHDVPTFSEAPVYDHGEYSSHSAVSYGLLETDFFGNDTILVDNHRMIAIESLWD